MQIDVNTSQLAEGCATGRRKQAAGSSWHHLAAAGTARRLGPFLSEIAAPSPQCANSDPLSCSCSQMTGIRPEPACCVLQWLCPCPHFPCNDQDPASQTAGSGITPTVQVAATPTNLITNVLTPFSSGALFSAVSATAAAGAGVTGAMEMVETLSVAPSVS